MKKLVFTAMLALAGASHARADSFTCSSPEVIDTLKKIDADNKDWKGVLLAFGLSGSSTLRIGDTDISGIATAEDGCRATITHNWIDIEGNPQKTDAIVLYAFNPTDDGKEVYVRIIEFERSYDFNAMMGTIAMQEAAAAERKRRESLGTPEEQQRRAEEARQQVEQYREEQHQRSLARQRQEDQQRQDRLDAFKQRMIENQTRYREQQRQRDQYQCDHSALRLPGCR